MKKILSVLCLVSLAMPLFGSDFAFTLKHHSEHSRLSERPFGDGDLSFGLYMEFFEGPAGWRLGAAYSDDLSGESEGEPEVDRVITPELTLLVQDGAWEGGVSVLRDYVRVEGDEGWGSTYFQMQLGYNFSLGRQTDLGVHTFYPFKSFGKLSEFRLGDLDFGLTLRYRF